MVCSVVVGIGYNFTINYWIWYKALYIDGSSINNQHVIYLMWFSAALSVF